MTTAWREDGLLPACEYGPSGHCTVENHDSCAHRPGGPQERGCWSPETYVVDSRGRALAQVIRPSHVWRCSCDCHSKPWQYGRLW